MNTSNTRNACKRRLAMLALSLIVFVALAGFGETKTVQAQANTYNTYTNTRTLNSCPPPGHPEALTPGTDYTGNRGCIDGQGNSYYEDGTNAVPGINPPQFYQSKLIVSPLLVFEWIIKYGVIICGVVVSVCLIICLYFWFVTGQYTTTRTYMGIMKYQEVHFGGTAPRSVFWTGVFSLVVLLCLLGLVYGTGTAGYMSGDLAVNDFCYYISNQNYQAAYDHFSSNIQKSYSEKDFETYLKNKVVKGCNSDHTDAIFYNGLQSQRVPLGIIEDPVYGDFRINTFSFNLWNM